MPCNKVEYQFIPFFSKFFKGISVYSWKGGEDQNNLYIHTGLALYKIQSKRVLGFALFIPEASKMIEVVLNDRLGKKVKVKCNEDDTIGDLKKLVAAQTGTRADKIRIQKWYNVYKDHITLKDYEIHDGMGLELYYN